MLENLLYWKTLSDICNSGNRWMLPFKWFGYATKLDTMSALHRVLLNGSLMACSKRGKCVRFLIFGSKVLTHVYTFWLWKWWQWWIPQVKNTAYDRRSKSLNEQIVQCSNCPRFKGIPGLRYLSALTLCFITLSWNFPDCGSAILSSCLGHEGRVAEWLGRPYRKLRAFLGREVGVRVPPLIGHAALPTAGVFGGRDIRCEVSLYDNDVEWNVLACSPKLTNGHHDLKCQWLVCSLKLLQWDFRQVLIFWLRNIAHFSRFFCMLLTYKYDHLLPERNFQLFAFYLLTSLNLSVTVVLLRERTYNIIN